MGTADVFEVYAIRYAKHAGWPKPVYFNRKNPTDNTLSMDFFFYALVSGSGAVYVVDTGFRPEDSENGEVSVIAPNEGLRAIGIEPASVRELILSHLHYDHAGNLSSFPNATIHLQKTELEFATGPFMRFPTFRFAYRPEHIHLVVNALYDGRARSHDGSADVAAGLSVHRVGGHTDGIQVIRVMTRRGWIVLANDAIHYYEELERRVPWTNAFKAVDMLQGYEDILALVDTPDHVIAGHDPLVMKRYPAASPSLEGKIVRLDLPPQ